MIDFMYISVTVFYYSFNIISRTISVYSSVESVCVYVTMAFSWTFFVTVAILFGKRVHGGDCFSSGHCNINISGSSMIGCCKCNIIDCESGRCTFPCPSDSCSSDFDCSGTVAESDCFLDECHTPFMKYFIILGGFILLPCGFIIFCVYLFKRREQVRFLFCFNTARALVDEKSGTVPLINRNDLRPAREVSCRVFF